MLKLGGRRYIKQDTGTVPFRNTFFSLAPRRSTGHGGNQAAPLHAASKYPQRAANNARDYHASIATPTQTHTHTRLLQSRPIAQPTPANANTPHTHKPHTLARRKKSDFSLFPVKDRRLSVGQPASAVDATEDTHTHALAHASYLNKPKVLRSLPIPLPDAPSPLLAHVQRRRALGVFVVVVKPRGERHAGGARCRPRVKAWGEET